MAKIKSINQLLVRMLATTMIFLILFSGIGAAVGPLETVFNDNNPLKILKNDGDATKYPTSRYFGFDNSNISMEVNMTQSGLEVYGEIGIIDENSSPIPGAFVADEDFDEFNFTDIGGGSYHYLNYTLPPTEENFWAIMIYVGESTGNNTNMSNGADGRPDPFIIVMNLNPKDFPLLGDNTTDWTEIEDFTNATLNFEGLDVDDDMTILGTLGYLELLDPINMCNNDTQNALMELGNYLDIDEGNMSLDSEALFALNVSSRLTMYDLEFDGTPGILMDGVLEYNGTSANNMISNFTWYAGNGTLVFEVEHWTSYYADGVGPTVTPITPQGTAVFNDDTLSLNVSASDLSGVASVTVNISNVNDTLTTAILSQDGDYWTNNSIIVNTRNTGTLSMQVNATDTLGISNTGVSLTVSKATFTHDVADGESIQAAINAANFSDTINVASDTYKENIVVNATGLILIGTGMPVVDAMGLGNAVEVTADGVTINGFNATNATYGPDLCGFLIESNNNTLTGNAANNNDYGIRLSFSSNNTLTGNNASDNFIGTVLDWSNNNTLNSNNASDNFIGTVLGWSNNNTLNSNNASDNIYGIQLSFSSNNNQIYNNYFNNTFNAYDDGTNIWNTTPALGTNIIGESWLGGNYWSDYTGVDMTGDSLGDTLTSYNSSGEIINGGDYHPLVATPPTIIIVLPQERYNYTTSTVELNVSADEAIDTWQYNINGIGNVVFTPNTTLTFSDGDYNITVYANDSAGNIGSTMVNFTVDATAPTVTIDLPVERYNYNTSTVELNVSADEAIDTWQYNINGTGNVIFIPNKTLILPEGNHNITVFANDSVGNIGSAMVNFTVDMTAPVIYNVSLSDTSPSYGQEIVVSVNVTDVHTNVISVTAGSTSLIQQSEMLWNGTITAGYGANTVTVTAYDNASNSAANTSFTYTGPAAPTDDSSSGSGGRYTPPLPENVDTQEVKGSTFSDPVSSAELVFKDGDVFSVIVDANGMMSEIRLTVQSLVGKPEGVTAPQDGGIYSYLDITLGSITNDDIEGATIQFKVDKKWLSENGGDTDSVALMRFHDVWETLETMFVSEDGEYYYFSARTPGFSTFAIAVAGEGEVAAVDDTTTTTEVLDDTKPITQSGVESDTEEEASSLPGFSIIMGILGIVSVILVRRK